MTKPKDLFDDHAAQREDNNFASTKLDKDCRCPICQQPVTKVYDKVYVGDKVAQCYNEYYTHIDHRLFKSPEVLLPTQERFL